MNFLDVRTVIFSELITDALCTVVLIFLWQQNRKRYAGMFFWVLDFIFQTMAILLIVLRGSIPDWLSIGLSSPLVIAGAYMGFLGLEGFVGKRSPQAFNYILLGIFGLVHVYFTGSHPDLDARNLNVSAGLLIICSQCAWIMLKQAVTDLNRITRAVGGVFALFCLVSVMRIFVILAFPQPNNDLFKSGLYDTLILLIFQLLLILLTFGLALMINRRLIVDVKLQEEKFIKAFHSSPYGILISRLSDGLILDMNRGFEKITGYLASEAVGRTTLDLQLWIRESDRQQVLAELSARSDVQGKEFEFRAKSGKHLTCLFYAEILTVDNEELLLSSINDISERKQAEEKLRGDETRLHLALVAAKGGVWEWNLQTNENIWSEELWKVYGLEPYSCEPSYEAWLQTVHPDDREAASQAVQKAAQDGSELYAEWRVRDMDGTDRWVMSRGQPICEADGQVIRYIGTVLDITERKQADQALRESEEKFRKAFMTSPDAININRLSDGKYISINNGFTQIMGYGEEEVTGKTSFELNIWADPEDRKALVAGLLKNGEVKNLEARFNAKNGDIRYGLMSASMFSLDNVPHIMSITRDITERKRAEEEIHRLNESLEQHVRERTAQLEGANKELEAFAYSVSHDLRAPLRGIDGWSLALLEEYQDLLDEKGKSYLVRVRSETQRMGQLIDDMLQLSRVTRTEMQFSQIDLSALAQTVIARLTVLQPDRQVEMSIQTGLTCRGDATLLGIVLTNLFENAWKFTAKCGEARIEFGQTEMEGRQVYFVRDNGVGFDMIYAQKLFGAFQRLHKASEYSGTGIGLATVQRIIRRHGGQVWAKAQVNYGATFYFTLEEGAS
jgi:PAS domain S-box-containing protein